MNQIQQQGKDMLEIVNKYEVPYKYHNALWAAYEAGAEMGFWKAAGVGSQPKLVSEHIAPKDES